jgi:hypothetical protein
LKRREGERAKRRKKRLIGSIGFIGSIGCPGYEVRDVCAGFFSTDHGQLTMDLVFILAFALALSFQL